MHNYLSEKFFNQIILFFTLSIISINGFSQTHIVPISATTTAGEFGGGTEIENIFDQATGFSDPLVDAFTNTCSVGASQAYISAYGNTTGTLTVGIPVSTIDALHVWNGWSTACELNHSLNNLTLSFYDGGTLLGTETITVPMPDGSGLGFVVPFGSTYVDVDEVTIVVNSLHGGNEIGIIELGFRSGEVACDDMLTTVSATEVCLGEEVTLEATSTHGGTITWDGGVTNGVAFVPPVGVTTYTATSDSDDDCDFSVEITVYDLPVVSGTADATEICLGDEVILTGSGAVTYIWDGGVTDGVAHEPLTAGINTFTVTGTDANGCENTATVDVDVLAPPAIDAGEDVEVCEGGAV
uniref:hypothetical protein n=1 Tax=Crocinitomix algicola TaxID=1740263 RepID=UPI001112E1EA